jgi:hypothetical protein
MPQASPIPLSIVRAQAAIIPRDSPTPTPRRSLAHRDGAKRALEMALLVTPLLPARGDLARLLAAYAAATLATAATSGA